MSEEDQGMRITKLPTGIYGMDELIGGGFQHPSNIYLVGEPGAGKTTFATQYLCEGAKHGEKGIYFSTLGEPAFFALSYMSRFEFYDSAVFEEKAFFKDLYDEITQEAGVEGTFEAILKIVDREKPTRVVIDSLTPLAVHDPEPTKYRAALFEMLARLKVSGCTTLLVGEIGSENTQLESYLADSVIHLRYRALDERIIRRLKIVKCRSSRHSELSHPYQIIRGLGLVVKSMDYTQKDSVKVPKKVSSALQTRAANLPKPAFDRLQKALQFLKDSDFRDIDGDELVEYILEEYTTTEE